MRLLADFAPRQKRASAEEESEKRKKTRGDEHANMTERAFTIECQRRVDKLCAKEGEECRRHRARDANRAECQDFSGCHCGCCVLG